MTSMATIGIYAYMIKPLNILCIKTSLLNDKEQMERTEMIGSTVYPNNRPTKLYVQGGVTL